MATTAAAANVISLDSYPARRSASRRSAELRAAMRRHPSYQGPPPEPREDRENAVVISFRQR